MTEEVKSPFGSDFGKPRSYDFDSEGFSREEMRAIERVKKDAAIRQLSARPDYAGVPMSQAVTIICVEGFVKSVDDELKMFVIIICFEGSINC